jgi:hypothetical protein
VAIGLDLRANGGDGLRIENAQAGQFLGVASHVNTGRGVALLPGALGQAFWSPYLEANGSRDGADDLVIAPGADQNIVFGTRPQEGEVYVDEGTGNLVLGRSNQIAGFPPFFRSGFGTAGLLLKHMQAPGAWELRQGADGAFEIVFKQSGLAPVDVAFGHQNGGAVRVWIPQMFLSGREVTVALPDSCGRGYRCLRIPNQ